MCYRLFLVLCVLLACGGVAVAASEEAAKLRQMNGLSQ